LKKRNKERGKNFLLIEIKREKNQDINRLYYLR